MSAHGNSAPAAWPLHPPPAPLGAQLVHALPVDNVQNSVARIDRWRLRHELRRARHLVLKCDVVAALHIVDRLECCLADWPAHETQRLRADIGFVRAMSCALQDDSEG